MGTNLVNNRLLRRGVRSLLAACVLLGCATDDAPPGPGAEYDNDIPEPFLYSEVDAPYAKDDVEACKAYASADEGLTETQAARRDCFCTECTELMRQCDSLPGCSEIRRCSWRTGCADSNACYLILAQCRPEIDKWGNGSVSTAIQTELGTCGCL